MAELDFSMYRNRPTLGQSLSGLAQSIYGVQEMQRKKKLDELSFQQEQIRRQQAESEFAKQKDYNERMNKYKAMVQQMYESGTLNEQELAKARMQIFAPEIAEQQIKNPFEAERVQQRGFELGIREKNAVLNKEKSDFLQKHRDRVYDFQNKKFDASLINANRNYQLAVDKFNYDKSGNKIAMQYAMEDAELLQEITPELQEFKKPKQDLNEKSIEQINSGTAAVGALLALSSKLKNDVQQFGTQKIKGDKKAEMNSRVTALMASLNNDMFYKAGVLQAGDTEAILSIIGDPTAFTTLTGNEALARMKSLEDFIEAKYVAALDARGIEGKKGYKAILKKYDNYFSQKSRQLDDDDEEFLQREGF